MSLNAERLKQARNKLGISLDELADRTGLHRSQLYRYERGNNDPTSSTLTALARELGVSIDYLVGLSDEPQGKIGDSLTSDELEVLNAYRRADVPAMLEICTDLARKAAR